MAAGLDDGRLTDGQGRTVDFKNTIIIMTSNLGSEILLNEVKGETISPEVKQKVMKLAQAHFKPEFLNRIDDIIMFTPLDLAAIEKIVDKFINQLSQRLADQEIKLKISALARKWLAKQGYDPAYGARPLARFITEKVETPLAKELIGKKILPHSIVIVDLLTEPAGQKKLIFTAEQTKDA